MGLLSLFGRKKAPTTLPTAGESVLDRVARILRANAHAALDKAEDPLATLDLLVRDYREAMVEAREAVARTIASLRALQAQHQASLDEAAAFGLKASAAAQRAQLMSAKNKTAEAEKATGLARVAVQRQLAAEQAASRSEPTIQRNEQIVEQLKDGLGQMEQRLQDLFSKREELVARSAVADAQNAVVNAVGAINSADPLSAIANVERAVTQKEALALGRAEVAATSIESQFDELEALAAGNAVEERMQRLGLDQAAKGVLR